MLQSVKINIGLESIISSSLKHVCLNYKDLKIQILINDELVIVQDQIEPDMNVPADLWSARM